MKHEPGDLTARESLDLIAAMIRQAKGNVQRNNFYFLLRGCVSVETRKHTMPEIQKLIPPVMRGRKLSITPDTIVGIALTISITGFN